MYDVTTASAAKVSDTKPFIDGSPANALLLVVSDNIPGDTHKVE